jgi:hypothetical protein
VKRRRPLRRKAAISPAGTIAPGGSLPRPSQISGGRGRRSDPITPEVRAEVLARDRWCVLAKFEPDHECFGMLELHHRKLRRHGDHSADNLCVLCTAGHLWVHTHVAVARAHGLLLRSTEFVGPLEAP